MTTLEVRDALVLGLATYLGCPVVLSDQTVPEADYPYAYYQPLQSEMPRGGANIDRAPRRGDGDSIDVETTRTEWVDGTYSIVACSRNRQGPQGYIYGDDEAQSLADRARGWLLHAGIPYHRAKGIEVVAVMGLNNRTALEIDEIDRRYGFDIRLRHRREDVRIDPAIARIHLRHEEDD